MKKPLLWGLVTAPVAAYVFFLRPQMLKWGTRLGESQRRLPGDEIVPKPTVQATRAIDIDAPAEIVWPWIAQMGRDKTGWYALDLLDNDGIPSANYIRQDLPAPLVGTKMDRGFEILMLEPRRLLVFGGFDVPLWFGVQGNLSITCLLEPRGKRTRLIMRVRGYRTGLGSALYNALIFEWLDFLNVARQLWGIRRRAEACEPPIGITIASGR
jgi:hypothetical protein